MKYNIDFDSEQYKAGAGKDFIHAAASLDGDWICHAFSVPMDRYYRDLPYQRIVRDEAVKAVGKELDLDLINFNPFDTGVVLNASLFGGTPHYHSNSTPVLEPVINEPADVYALEKRIDALSDEALLYEGVLHKKFWEASSFWSKSRGLSMKAPASGGTKGIATVCGQLCGVTNFLMWIMTDPVEMRALTALVGRTFMRYIKASRDFDGLEDLNGLGLASDLTGLMSPDSYIEFCGSEEKDLYEAFALAGERYYHSDSNMERHVEALSSIGVTTVNIGPMVSVNAILSQNRSMKIDGQIPPVRVLWQGSTDLVVDAARQDINDMINSDADLSYLKVCTAGSINPGTPLDNIRAMYWTAMNFGRLKMDVDPGLSSIPIEFDRKEMVNQIS